MSDQQNLEILALQAREQILQSRIDEASMLIAQARALLVAARIALQEVKK